MQVTVKTFAQTREITGEDNIALHLSENSTVETVISQLKTRSDKWALALEGSVLTKSSAITKPNLATVMSWRYFHL